MKDRNLSAHCLTSREAYNALNCYLATHPALHDEIKKRMGVVHGVDIVATADTEDLKAVNANVDDDADVPSSAVMQDAFNLSNGDIPAGIDVVSHCVGSIERGPDNSLMAVGESEDIWKFISFN